MNYSQQIASLVGHLSNLNFMINEQENLFYELVNIGFDTINRGGRICITGVGKNASLAMKTSETMASLGVPSQYLNTAHLSHGDFGFIGPRDIIFHLSRSGTTSEMLHASHHLKFIAPGIIQILICCREPDHFNESKEHYSFNRVFYTGEAIEIDANHLAPTTSTTLLLAFMDLIGTHISFELGFSKDDFYRYHPGGALGKMLKEEINSKTKFPLRG